MFSGFQSNGFQNNGYQIVRSQVDQVFGGAGHIVYKKRVKRHNVSEMLDMAMREIYEIATAKNEPQTIREAAAKIVKPYAKGKGSIPDANKVNWAALEHDVKRVEMLVALYQQKLDDNEVVKMALEYYYH